MLNVVMCCCVVSRVLLCFSTFTNAATWLDTLSQEHMEAGDAVTVDFFSRKFSLFSFLSSVSGACVEGKTRWRSGVSTLLMGRD